jgi:NADPH:quinone reductase-like Zn-dependent oxidoreductase
MANHRLSPVVERTFPLARTAEAIAHMETRHATAKIVLALD